MATKNGYQPSFIGSDLPVPFPEFNTAQLKDLALPDAKKTGELTYPHFSLLLSKSRRFPYFTATNINGHLFKKIPRKTIFPSGDQWSVETRATDYQWGAHLYSAKKSDFQRKITFHIARHSFASTVTLDNGIPIDPVSKMLGHRSIKTTPIYAKVSAKKINDDTQKMFQTQLWEYPTRRISQNSEALLGLLSE